VNGLLASIIAGVVITLIGAFAAYYFGVRQERQRRDYERRINELEAREEKERELSKLGAEAIDVIRPQVASLAKSYTSWVEAISDLIIRKWSMPPAGALVKASQVEKHGAAVSNSMHALEPSYWEQKPSLTYRTRDIFESFDKELREHQSALSEAWSAWSYELKDNAKREANTWHIEDPFGPYGLGRWPLRKLSGTPLDRIGEKWVPAIKSAQNWDVWRYVALLDEEAEKLRRMP
jgi:hypothetical protein